MSVKLQLLVTSPILDGSNRRGFRLRNPESLALPVRTIGKFCLSLEGVKPSNDCLVLFFSEEVTDIRTERRQFVFHECGCHCHHRSGVLVLQYVPRALLGRFVTFSKAFPRQFQDVFQTFLYNSNLDITRGPNQERGGLPQPTWSNDFTHK